MYVYSDHALQMLFRPQLPNSQNTNISMSKGLKAYIHGQWLLNTNAKTNQDIQSENMGDLHFYYCDKNSLIGTFHKNVTK